MLGSFSADFISAGMQEALLQLVVIAAPAVILYFTGWSYLYFYLNAFQINISEINFDVPTVFMYSYPPLYMLWLAHPRILIGIAVAIPVAALLARAVWLSRRQLPRRVRYNLVQRLVKFVWQRCKELPATIWTLVLLLVLVFILPFPMQALTKWAAHRTADSIWDGQTVELDGLLSTEAGTPPEPRGLLLGWWLSPLRPQAPEGKYRSKLIDNYWSCKQQGELHLVFASEAHYYLLCRASSAPATGNVFEVSGKEGLISVRRGVYRELPEAMENER